MGFRTGVTGAFQTYSLSRMYRLEQGDNTMDGAARARRRDAAFGDNR